MSASANSSVVAIGVIFTLLGLLILAGNIGIVTLNFDILKYWPSILIYFGVSNILKYLFGVREELKNQ